ncbi:MAG: MCE family protein [Nitrospinae bacterium]|nr:MCE family protein [Nitrospinota bacterium]
MTDLRPDADAPAPVIKDKSGPSIVWLIPIITALIGGWLIFKTLSEKGTQISITFKTAEGIEAGKTKIKYKEIEVGVVDAALFSKDFSYIILKATINKDARALLRRDTRFWVVKPRMSLREVSGLGTLVSGSYIELEPGQGAPHKNFIGLDAPPAVRAEESGKKITLLAKKLGSIGAGSPVYYQKILAGEVLGYELANDRKSVLIHAFIKAPFDEMVQSSTQFWNVSGFDFSMGAEGVNVRAESVESLLFGGIAFDTPVAVGQEQDQEKEDVEGLIFTLHDNLGSIQEQAFTTKLAFVLFFDDSVKGLTVGAPVDFKGIKVGSVTDVRLEFDKRDAGFRIPVNIEIEPERIINMGEKENASPYQTFKDLVDRGLRAQLRTGSFLTGQLFIALDMHPEVPARLVGGKTRFPELPTIPASLEQMATSVKTILTKIEKLDLDKIFSQLSGALEGTNRLVNSPELMDTLKGADKFVNAPELHEAVKNLKGSMHEFQSILGKLDKRAEPLLENVEKAIGTGNATLEKAQITLGMVSDVLKPDSPLQFRLNQMTEELAETARSIRTFIDLLERNPKSIIFGKNPPGEKQ